MYVDILDVLLWSQKQNHWKDSCMNLSFLMLFFLGDVWKEFGAKSKISEKIHTGISFSWCLASGAKQNYWKESCTNLSFVMLIFLEDIWRAFGTNKQNCWKDSCMNPSFSMLLEGFGWTTDSVWRGVWQGFWYSKPVFSQPFCQLKSATRGKYQFSQNP